MKESFRVSDDVFKIFKCHVSSYLKTYYLEFRKILEND